MESDCSLFEHSNSSTISLLDLLDKEEQNKKDIQCKDFLFPWNIALLAQYTSRTIYFHQTHTKVEARLEEIFYFVIVGMNPPLYFAHPKNYLYRSSE